MMTMMMMMMMMIAMTAMMKMMMMMMMVMLMISFSDQSPIQYKACVRNGKLHRNDDGVHNIVSSGGRYW